MSDGSLQRSSARNKKFCEGWLEHKAHRPTGYRYERLFALLEGNVIYIFDTDVPSQDTQVGNLTIDSNTEFIKGKGHPSKGFKFDLNTGKRLNRFKTKKSTERELWRGYVIGISKGDVPNDLDLLDSEVKEIKRNVAAFHGSEEVDYDPKRSSIASGISQRSQMSRGKDSGVVSLGGMSRQSGSSSDDTRSRRSVASTVSGTVDQGGPTVVHKFYNDHNRDQRPPSWFLPHCSREMAEKVLERANSENYGNTLMRESTSYLSNGSYVISKINVNKRDGRVEFEHFEVIRTSQGYKVNVQNQHQPMKCLQDVMDYFVGTSGGSTRPLEVNDPKFLEQDTPGYSTQIHFKRPESWKWPPQDSRDEPMPDRSPRQHYENASTSPPLDNRFPSSPPIDNRFPSSPPSDSRFRNIEGSQTVSAGILRNQRPLPSPGASERKSVGWSSVINTPPPIPDHSKTFAGSRTKQGPIPSMSELAQRTNEAEQIEKFDTMLSGFESGFERNSVYVNSSSNRQKVTSPACATPPTPPPPPAHQFIAPRSYENVNPASEHVDPALDALPVAPPAPRDPIVSSPSSINSRSSLSKASSTGFSALSQSSSPSVNLRNSSSDPSNQTKTAQNRPAVSKSLTENQLRSMRSPDSPKNFPTWGTPKQSVSLQNHNIKPKNNAGVNASAKEETVGGIDDSTQGGVSTLRNRFESASDTSAQSKAGRVRSSLPPRWSVSSQLSETIGELDDLYEYLSEDGTDFTNTNNQATKTNNSRSLRNSKSVVINPHVNNDSLLTVGRTQSSPNMSSQSSSGRRQRLPVDEDNFYDDTFVHQQQQQESAERKVQFQQQRQSSIQTPVQCGKNEMRRKTEPAISISKTEFEGLNQSFKNKLEGLFGGNPAPGPVANKGSRNLPATPENRQLSDDHEYQELPDMIPPDAVTYVNERFNVN